MDSFKDIKNKRSYDDDDEVKEMIID